LSDLYKNENFESKFKSIFNLHFLLFLHWKLNLRFNYVRGQVPLRNFPKIIPWFLSIFERNHERIAVGAGVKSFFEFNFFPIDLMLKVKKIFFSGTRSDKNLIIWSKMCHYICHRTIRSKVLAHPQWHYVSSSFLSKLISIKNIFNIWRITLEILWPQTVTV
jgi:hypothetical protein